MLLEFVNHDGSEDSIESELSTYDIIVLFDKGKRVYNYPEKDEPSIMDLAFPHLKYSDHMKIRPYRGSVTFKEAVEAYIVEHGYVHSDAEMKRLGYFPAEVTPRGPNEGILTKSDFVELGKLVVDELVAGDIPDGKMVTLDWAKDCVSVVMQSFLESELILPDFPVKLDRSDRLKAELSRLEYELAGLRKDAKIRELKSRREELRSTAMNLEGQSDELKGRKTKAEAEVADAKKKVAEIEASITGNQSTLSDCDTQISQIDEELKTLID